jgi:hypothetical protein
MATNKKQPQTLVHFTSGPDGTKNSITEIVKPGSASAVFMQRMEKHQINKPCYKTIDLRNKTDQQIFEYEYQGLIHHLNSEAIELFENLLTKYDYVYTDEIHNIVIAQFQKQISKKPPEPSVPIKSDHDPKNSIEEVLSKIGDKETTVKTKPLSDNNSAEKPLLNRQTRNGVGTPVKIIPFGYHRHQHEVRMLYMSEIQIYTEIDNKWTDAKTINISVSGLKVKMSQIRELYEGQKLAIHFTGLNTKFGKPFHSINFEVVDINFQNEDQIVRLIRVIDEEDEEFVSTLSKFIDTNRRRYKIDLDDFIASVKSKYLERIYSLNSQHSTLFFHKFGMEIKLKHLLSNQFSVGEKRLVHILSELDSKFEFIHTLVENPTNKKAIYSINIYSFEEPNETGTKTLYSALDSDFYDDKEKYEFLKLALASENYHGWTLLIKPCEKLSQGANSSYISESEDISIDEAQKLQKELSTIVATGKLVDNKQMALLQLALFSNYPKNDLFSIDKFVCESKQKHYLPNIKVAQKKQRNENRYYLTTSVEVDINGKISTGQTLDFSPNGVKVQLDSAITAEKRDNADISFPGLQTKFKKESLSKQHFRVAHISRNGKTVCFSRDRRFVLHEASVFFRKLIDCNLHKLTQCSGDTFVVVRSAMLEHIQTRNLQTIPFFIILKNHALKVDQIAANENPTPLLWEFKDSRGYNFDSIFDSELWNKIISICGKNNKIEVLYETEIFLYKNDKFQSWRTSISEDYKSLSSQNKFIQKISEAPYKKVIHLSITPTNLFDDSYIVDDLNEIRNNSANQSDSLQGQLKRIRALGELVEITNNYFS